MWIPFKAAFPSSGKFGIFFIILLRTDFRKGRLVLFKTNKEKILWNLNLKQ